MIDRAITPGVDLTRARPLGAAIVLAALVSLTVVSRDATASAGDQPKTIERPRVVETTFQSVDATIAAQWDFPRQSPAPLVVIIPTGGRIDRNGWAASLGENPDAGIYAKLAENLVDNGFAVFRYDKPGAGRSGRGLYATERSSALEAYTRAVDHARIDPESVFLLGHSMGTDSIAGIYPRYEAVLEPAGVILMDNSVGEGDSLRIKAPTLIVNAGKNPDDRFQYGQFVAEARSKAPQGKLETELVIIDDAETGLMAPVPDGTRVSYVLHPDATRATVDWLRRHRTKQTHARLPN